MALDLDDTIAAIASAPGGAVRGIVRLSGPQAIECALQLARFPADAPPISRMHASCTRATVRLPEPLGDVPAVVYLWPTARSYTRQPSAELHLPGSPPILEAALVAGCRSGARLAKPGEFTLRAFLAGRLDLTQAEAVLGVIDAQGQAELNTALQQLAGGLGRPLHALREQLLDLLAHLEAGLDFAHEDIDFISPAELQTNLAANAQAVGELAERMQSRGEAGRLPRVVLVGLPNVGKSSLLNALAGESAAIVSEIAGTTRDFVARRVTIGGTELLLTDTAGWAMLPTDNAIDAAAQRMSRGQSQQADLTLLCLDASRPLAAWEREQLRQRSPRPRLVVATKCDLAAAGDFAALGVLRTSSRTGAGLPELSGAISSALDSAAAELGVVAGTADRCRESLRLAAAALERATVAARSALGEELVAAEVRGALEELGQVVGAVYTEDLLDRVFSRFCIGK
jgi:tRNA modification GTPase